MNEYLTEQEERALLKKWWNDYGKSIAIAIVVGLAASYGWRYWQQHKLQRAERASAIYQQLVAADTQAKQDQVEQLAAELQNHYAKSPYATLANFHLAADAVNAAQYQKALINLRWVRDHSNSPEFKQIARLRSARILLQLKQPQSALDTVKPVEDSSFQGLIDQVQGDAYSALGQKAQAKAHYQAAMKLSMTSGQADPLLSLKVNRDAALSGKT